MVIGILDSGEKRLTLAKLTVLCAREVPLIDGFILNELLIAFEIALYFSLGTYFDCRSLRGLGALHSPVKSYSSATMQMR